LFNLPTGGVFGPYVFNDFQAISKMVGKKANASAKASHILIAYAGAPQSAATRTKEEAQAFANTLLAQAKANPDGFANLAMTNSDDPGSKNNGGEYDNIAPGQMVPTFNDFVFNNSVGAIGMVETDFGFHVIKVTGKYDAVLLGTVAQKIQPSDATVDATYSKASQFESDAMENKDFAALAKKEGLEVVSVPALKPIDEFIQSLGAQREIVRWTFSKNTKINDIKRFETPQGFVIAKLKGKNETGLLSVEEARQVVDPILRNKKKAELIKKKMSGTGLEAIAKASGASVIPASGITMKTPVIPNVGNEPKIVGKAFNLASGKTSEILEGNSGMFVILAKSETKAADLPSYATYINQEGAQNQGYAVSKAYSALKEKATIKDNRASF
jgi:peptidyl-prolyl cis-trans isomerase D